MGNPHHVVKLAEGKEAWNLWRHEHPGVVPDLSGADLSNRDGSPFRKAQLDGVDLSGANLAGANLERANLERANLSRANAAYANLESAFLEDATLSDTNLEGANLRRADLRMVDLRRANLNGAILVGANFSEGSLDGMDFRGRDLEGASFVEASVGEANFEEANLSGANFYGGGLEKANLKNANLHNANLETVNAAGANFEGAVLHGARLNSAHLDGANLTGAVLHGAYLTAANLACTSLERANLRAADLQWANLQGAVLYSADLSDANLQDATGVRFDDSKILRTRLTPHPGTFWQQLQPWFILSPLSDPWSTLRRAYTGANFILTLVALIAFLLPYAFQALAWRNVNVAQTMMRGAVAELGVRHESLMAWTTLAPCLSSTCTQYSVWQLLLAVDGGGAAVLFTVAVLLYNAGRFYLTQTVMAYRDEEERSGFTPRWKARPSPSNRAPTSARPTRWEAFRIRANSRWELWLSKSRSTLKRSFRSFDFVEASHTALQSRLGGYQHLVWLHICLRILFLVVVIAFLRNVGTLMFLIVEVPAP